MQATPSFEPKTNRRHDIGPDLIRAQIDRKVADLELQRIRYKKDAQATFEAWERAKVEGTAARWSRAPESTPETVDAMVDRCIERERAYYAAARVIELPTETDKRFILVYGDVDDATVTSGTGPFATVDEAAGWFLRTGR